MINRNHSTVAVLALAGTTLLASAANATTVAITEWAYNGDEFVEFTNLTGAAVDFTGWSFDDNSRAPGSVSLSGFGLVAAGESVILSEGLAADFRTRWGLPDSVKVIGGNTNNLGRADEINLYDASNNLVDRLTYDDQSFAGTIRTDTASGNPSATSPAALYALLDNDNVTTDWVRSTVGDAFGSYTSTAGFVANPGKFSVVPLPAGLPLLLSGLAGVAALRRRRA